MSSSDPDWNRWLLNPRRRSVHDRLPLLWGTLSIPQNPMRGRGSLQFLVVVFCYTYKDFLSPIPVVEHFIHSAFLWISEQNRCVECAALYLTFRATERDNIAACRARE